MTPITDSIDNQAHIDSGHETCVNNNIITNSVKPSKFNKIRSISINDKSYSEIVLSKKVKKEVPTGKINV